MLLTKYYSDDGMEENGMDETWGTFGKEGTFTPDFDGKT
jgi:hypothetical protein